MTSEYKMIDHAEYTHEILVDKITEFKGNDLSDLCDAAESTVNDSQGFSIGFNKFSDRSQVELYFKGVLLVPERELIVGRFDGAIAGSIQLVKPSISNVTSAFAASVDNHFVAPWARGFGLANSLLAAAEEEARKCGFSVIKLSVNATRDAAISLYENNGYKKWGVLDKYELYADQVVPGYFYCKDL